MKPQSSPCTSSVLLNQWCASAACTHGCYLARSCACVSPQAAVHDGDHQETLFCTTLKAWRPHVPAEHVCYNTVLKTPFTLTFMLCGLLADGTKTWQLGYTSGWKGVGRDLFGCCDGNSLCSPAPMKKLHQVLSLRASKCEAIGIFV